VLCSFSLHINNTTFIYQSSRNSHTSHFHTPSTSVKMQYSILALATAASYVSAQSLSTPSASASAIGAVVPVGGACDPKSTVCALGSSCYAVNSDLKTYCGNFQAQCTSNQQCAFNTCNGGFCNGLLSSSSSASATVTSTSVGGYTPAPSSTVTAPAGSLPLGAECDAQANPSQCTAGVQCWASNAGLIASCGNFNAACSSDAQCAYNTCNNGLCSGFRSSGAGNATSTVQPTGSLRPSGSATATTTSAAQFTGAASVANVANGVAAVVLGAVALVL
jgi:hypothetical protein